MPNEFRALAVNREVMATGPVVRYFDDPKMEAMMVGMVEARSPYSRGSPAKLA